jgi:hypothetical protein
MLTYLVGYYFLVLQNINFGKKKLRSGKTRYSRMRDFQNGMYFNYVDFIGLSLLLADK